MTLKLAAVIALQVSLIPFVNGADQTLVSGASGTAVAKAAVAKVLSCGIFPDDHGVLRKIGWVESKDGTDPNTYRPGYNGGIWQVILDCSREETKIIDGLGGYVIRLGGSYWSRGHADSSQRRLKTPRQD